MARNTNAHSAKAKVQAATRKIREYSHEVEIGEGIEIVKTTCKEFGGCFLTKQFKLDGDCMNCTQSKYIQDMCKISTNPAILDFGGKIAKAAKIKTEGSGRSPRIFKIRKIEATDTVSRIVAFLQSNGNTGRTMKEIKAHIGTKRTLYTTCGGHPDRIRKDGNLFFAVHTA